MKDEILAGLRNAMERGYSLEAAAKSFVNAGYNPQEVKAAAASLSEGVSDIIYSEPKPSPVLDNTPVLKNEAPEAPKANILENKPVKKSRRKSVIIIILVLLLIFLGALGYLIYSFAT